MVRKTTGSIMEISEEEMFLLDLPRALKVLEEKKRQSNDEILRKLDASMGTKNGCADKDAHTRSREQLGEQHDVLIQTLGREAKDLRSIQSLRKKLKKVHARLRSKYGAAAVDRAIDAMANRPNPIEISSSTIAAKPIGHGEIISLPDVISVVDTWIIDKR